MINVNLGSDGVIINCSNDVVFAEYSAAIEQGICWLMGKGSCAFKIQREKSIMTKEQVVKIISLMPTKVMTYSNISSIGVLANDGFFQKEIPFENRWTLAESRKEARDGQNRIFRSDEEKTIIQQYGLDAATSIGELAYGLADLATGFFWLGATCMQWQGSLGLTQVMINKGFAEDYLIKYLTDKEDGYSVHQKVSSLS